MRVKSAREQTGNDGKIYQAHKMLKAVSFKEPVFAPLSNDCLGEDQWSSVPLFGVS